METDDFDLLKKYLYYGASAKSNIQEYKDESSEIEQLIRNLVLTIQVKEIETSFIDISRKKIIKISVVYKNIYKKKKSFQEGTLYKIYKYFDRVKKILSTLQKIFFKKIENFNIRRKIYGEPCTKFSKLSYKRKKFYDFSTSKLLANFRVFDRFPTIKTTHKEPCIKFSKLFGHPKIFYRHFKKNFSKKSKISVIPLTLTFGENFKYFQ
ncbi:hypothetical protein AGLY_007921 [Aphis glycines]|uniref:Uncharacterized protein n=1 Tax=Aphis glycines TaxID=307491 RepID=A0A6G0TNY1_APHGL|nr:hypothetical protein AGLY_007921 [Aphis glycines]